MPYEKTAEFYDLIYSNKPYAREAEKIALLIAAERGREGGTLLDVACGTGAHLRYLRDWFEVEGIDLSADMLAVAHQRLPELTLRQGDMRTFDLGKQFDAITCLFSAIGYMPTNADVRAAIGNMAHHLRPGGVLLVEPWLTPDMAIDGHRSALFVESAPMSIARMGISRIEGRAIVMPLHHMVIDESGVHTFVAEHVLYLYTMDDMLQAFHSADLETRFDTDGLMGRGLYIAIKKGA